MRPFTSKPLLCFKFNISPKTSNRHSIKDTYFFNADSLVRDHCSAFIQAYCQAVILHGFPFNSAEMSLLNASLFLGMHASIIRLSPSAKVHQLKQTVMTYVHEKKKPAGINFPVQCPKCGFLRAWNIECQDFHTATFSCKVKNCNKVVQSSFPFKIDGFVSVNGTGDMNGGQWLHQISDVNV